jgi:hypothetical protein
MQSTKNRQIRRLAPKANLPSYSAFAVALAVVAAPARASAEESQPAAPAPAAAPPTALVHIQANDPASLRGFEPGRPSTALRVFCEAPCDAAVPLAGHYVIASEGTTSPEFTLHATAGRRELLTVTGARSARDWGDFLAAMGFLTTVYGGATLAWAVACHDQRQEQCRGVGWEVAGAVATGTGVAMLVGGGILWAKGAMRVKHSVSATTRRAMPSTSTTSALLTPTGGGASLPPAVKPLMLPIVSGRF